jgi:hypothetical protein
MPLNRLDNFIKNTDGRILYVSPSDLNATDSITNQGNALSQPFKTIQRALLESARFSYLRGNDNDITEKTTILLLPGEHLVDNRPGFALKDDGGVKAVTPSGTVLNAQTELSLTLTSNFDLLQRNNILYKFNSVYGGAIVPRGTSIVGLDLRKTKVRPLYVPNPTDDGVPASSIFRITGACYFWQLSLFDGLENTLVYTDNKDFSIANSANPTFSHHKLTCFEYADGVNTVVGYDLTDLDMYYSKVSNAYNEASGRDIDQKYPTATLGFTKQRPEWEIVGAFASDPIQITKIVSGDGFTPGNVITVTTISDHKFTAGTPIKINGISARDYNISTKVQSVISETEFTYILPVVDPILSANPNPAGGTVTIETDTVGGASPYIFNCSLRSVWGMNGMHADGDRASGFRSMVVAQFTGVSLQKDDRAFVKYDKTSRVYSGISPITRVTGSDLSGGATSTDPTQAYHLDSDAIYRPGWDTSHIKLSNDAFIQIVSVFAIGFNRHFDAQSGGDGSITNSNSNFGQIALNAEGFKNEAFEKDNTAVITSIIAPRTITNSENDIDWLSFDVGLTTAVGITSHLYLFGLNSRDDIPPINIQGYKVGAKSDDRIYVPTEVVGTVSANIFMADSVDQYGVTAIGRTVTFGTSTGEKVYIVGAGPTNNSLNLGINAHGLQTGESIRIFSDTGDLPENLDPEVKYYAIVDSSTSIKVASSPTNALLGNAIKIYGGTRLKVVSRVTDKEPGDVGHPIQFDTSRSNWYLHTNPNSEVYTTFRNYGVAGIGARSSVSNFKRVPDNRSIDEKIYKLRVFIPKEAQNTKDPTTAFVIQESSQTGIRSDFDPAITTLSPADYSYNRNPRFISSCTFSSPSSTITVTTELPHNLKVGEKVTILNVQSSDNPFAQDNKGYNGEFLITGTPFSQVFTYSSRDVFGVTRSPGTFTSPDKSVKTVNSPRYQRRDLQTNYYIYRSEVISQYIKDNQDGVYHLYVLNAGNTVEDTFTSLKYSQNVVDLYPQLDLDNRDENPQSAKTYAKRSPLGEVVTNDLKKSVTRETVDLLMQDFGVGVAVSFTQRNNTVGITTVVFKKDHGFAGIITYNSLTGGSGKVNGTYYNVKLYNSSSLIGWKGATATVTVSGGAVVTADITSPGSGYANGETLYFDTSKIGGAANATIGITVAGISTSIGNVVQFTGIGTGQDHYAVIASVPDRDRITFGSTTGDPTIFPNQYGIVVSRRTNITGAVVYNSTVGVATFTTSTAHGLLSGNKFRLLDASNNNLGEFVVKDRISVTSFNSQTNRQISPTPTQVLKLGFSANSGQSDSGNENLGVRDVVLFGNETLTLGEALTNSSSNTSFIVTSSSGIGTTKRFEIGSYIQIDSEIMRIATNSLTGPSNNKITVLRGQLGTIISAHDNNSLIKKIKPLPIEFRRPSILRASGHTFEYLGYGPGNYSTGLPQVQVKSLSEKEAYLVQSQQRSAGSVIYTGMNNDGDFYIGNTKYSAASGQQSTFSIPTPTITGLDPNRLSVVYDEVTIKERLLVEGGNSGTILSQFDGPVTFTKEVKIDNSATITGEVKINGNTTFNSTVDSTSKDSGAIVIEGGVGIEKNLNVGGSFNCSSNLTVTSNLTVNGNTALGNQTTDTTTISGNTTLTSGSLYFTGTSAATDGDIYTTGGSDSIFTIFNTSNSGTTIFQNKNSGGTYNDILTLSNSSATIDGTLIVNGTVTFNSNATVVANLTATGNLAVSGTTTLGDAITDTTTVNGSLGVTNNLTVNGNTTLGNATSDTTTVNGNLSVTQDITAFASDERLKTNIKSLENALDKVMQLSGFTYNFNEIGQKLGFDTEITYVGVSAQQVQAVLPEAVKSCPVDENYMTVQYEKLVPLLIEAIKELKAEINELKGVK